MSYTAKLEKLRSDRTRKPKFVARRERKPFGFRFGSVANAMSMPQAVHTYNLPGMHDMGTGYYFVTPPEVIEATKQALDEGFCRYLSNYNLNDVIAEKLRAENGIEADPDTEILVTGGISPGLTLVPMALLNPGDECLTIDPDYTKQESAAILGAHARVVKVPLKKAPGAKRPDSAYVFDPEEVEKRITPKTKMISFCNPNNPTGYVYSERDLKAIAAIAEGNDLFVLCNECYERMVLHSAPYGNEFRDNMVFKSFQAVEGMFDRSATVQGVTKAYQMSGFRVGWIVANADLIHKLYELKFMSGAAIAPSFSQFGAIAALTSPVRESHVRESIEIVEKESEMTCRELNELPDIDCPSPMGGQFVLPDISETGMTDSEMVNFLMEQVKVTIRTGSEFGPNGSSHVRLCICNPLEYQEIGLKKIKEAMRRRTPRQRKHD